MNYRETAKQILEKVGGEKNVAHLEHCSTRLRFTLVNNKLADVEALKKVPGVLGVVTAAQCQVVIGNSVIEVYDALMKLASFDGGAVPDDAPAAPADKSFKGIMKKIGSTLMDFMIGVFQPLVPAIAGAGMLKSVLLLINMIGGWFGYSFAATTAYTVINTFADAAFYFLPLLVADSVATKLKCNRYLSISAVAALMLPSMTQLIGIEGGLRIFGIPVTVVSYQYLVFPAILTVLVLSFVEKLFTKISPKPIRIFFVPMMTMLIVVPLSLVALGPVGFIIGEGLSTAIVFLYDTLGWVAVMLLAAVLPFMIATGMHKAMVPYAVSTYTAMGMEVLYLPASLAHNIAESGACFGAALRSKETGKRSTAVSAGVSALFGITEPALYGVTLQNKRVLGSVIIGALCGGAYIGITKVAGFAVVGPGLASLSMFISPETTSNIVNAVIGFGISFAAAFVAAILLTKEKKGKTPETAIPAESTPASVPATAAGVRGELTVPVNGKVVSLSEVPDDVFSAGVLGDGIAIIPEDGNVYAPADAVIDTVFDSKHAISMTTDFGADVLIHFGIDTVKLGGEGFEVLVSNGEKISRGQLIMKVDVEKLKEKGYNVVTPIILANSAEFRYDLKTGVSVKHGEALLALTKKEGN